MTYSCWNTSSNSTRLEKPSDGRGQAATWFRPRHRRTGGQLEIVSVPLETSRDASTSTHISSLKSYQTSWHEVDSESIEYNSDSQVTDFYHQGAADGISRDVGSSHQPLCQHLTPNCPTKETSVAPNPYQRERARSLARISRASPTPSNDLHERSPLVIGRLTNDQRRIILPYRG